MSHFEYVSVAIALIYSFALARLLGGLPHVGKTEGGSWITLGWTISEILASVLTWWIIWRFQDVDWTALRFLWLLGMPALIYLRAAVLITDNPGTVASWSAQFFRVRRLFFALGLVTAAHGILLPWVAGVYAWGALAPVHLFTPIGALINCVGLATVAPRVHLALPILMILLAGAALFFAPETL